MGGSDCGGLDSAGLLLVPSAAALVYGTLAEILNQQTEGAERTLGALVETIEQQEFRDEQRSERHHCLRYLADFQVD